MSLIVDIREIYNTYFQEPYHVGIENVNNNQIFEDTTAGGISVRKRNTVTGIEVFLPIDLTDNKGNTLTIDCATIRVTMKNTIIRTVVSERQGTIKEQFSAGDYVFTIKGVLIGENRNIPDEQIQILQEFAKNTTPIYLNNALAEIFMPGENRIAIESLEFPEQEGKHIRFRPFILVCETDFIDTLEVE